jgi:hypothetical protein
VNPFVTLAEALLVLLLDMMVWNATAWVEVTYDDHLVLACGDEDGDEIPCVPLKVEFDPWDY